MSLEGVLMASLWNSSEWDFGEEFSTDEFDEEIVDDYEDFEE